MKETLHFSLTPRDPLIARDGRPFGFGIRMKSLDWFYPSVTAGAFRTVLGHALGGFPDIRTAKSDYDKLTGVLKAVSVAGPFPHIGKELFLPAPHDIAVRKNEDASLDAFAARPADLRAELPGAGCDLPGGMSPALLPDSLQDDFKPERVPAFWSTQRMADWLTNATGQGFLQKAKRWPDGFLDSPGSDARTHVQMNYDTGANEDGMLYQTTGLAVEQFQRPRKTLDGISTDRLAVRIGVDRDDSAKLENVNNDCRNRLERIQDWYPFGGERRLVHWRKDENAVDATNRWSCPGPVRSALKDAPLVRMVLATPAIFDSGWKPDWLADAGSDHLEGSIPGTTVKVRLISASIQRWRAISGWGYEPYTMNGKSGATFGPKKVRRMVPAGGVYFFKVLDGKPEVLADQWLQSICGTDANQDHRDGFGLALWGVWKPADLKTNS